MPMALSILWMFLIQMLGFITQLDSAATKPPTAIIVFGDSSVDSGNNNYIQTVARCNFEPYGRDFPGGQATGRFCNGRLSPDFISEAFGLRPTVPAYLDPNANIPDFAVGVCFASAATGFDNATAEVLQVIPLWKQVVYFKEYKTRLEAYLGAEQSEETIRGALYIVSIGTNDFLENYYALTERRSQFTVEKYQDFLIDLAQGFLQELYSLGARRFSFTGLSPMGCLPAERTTNFMSPRSCMEEYNLVALEFNTKLEILVTKLNRKLPGIKILFANPYPIVHQLIQDPHKYGFEVAEEGCCGTGMFEMGTFCRNSPFTCTDANKYVFWDAIHPTERTNKIISDALYVELRKLFL